LSTETANRWFGTIDVAGKTLKVFTLGDTVRLVVAAVYRDFPQNSHERFNGFIHNNDKALTALSYDPADFATYGRATLGDIESEQARADRLSDPEGLSYRIQPIGQIYF